MFHRFFDKTKVVFVVESFDELFWGTAIQTWRSASILIGGVYPIPQVIDRAYVRVAMLLCTLALTVHCTLLAVS